MTSSQRISLGKLKDFTELKDVNSVLRIKEVPHAKTMI